MARNAQFKVSLLAVLLANTPTGILAQSFDAPMQRTFGGPFYGFGVGATTFMTDTTTDVTFASAADFSKNTVAKYGPMASLFVGTSQVFNDDWYLGVNLGLNILGATKTKLSNLQSANVIVTNTDSTLDIISTVHYNSALYTNTTVRRDLFEPFVDLKAGYLATPNVLTYLSAGLSYNRIKIQTESTFRAQASNNTVGVFSGTNTSDMTTSVFSSSHKNQVIGLRAGAGLEYLINPHLGLGANYIYTFYPRVRSSNVGVGQDVACDALEGCTTTTTDVSNTNHSKLFDQQILLQLVYHLC